jgi:hypothetical protein
MNGPPVIVGNSLAAMVAAQSLAERARDVVLANSLPRWGGHLAGFHAAGRPFDGGMVLFEFDSFNREPEPDLRGYDPVRRNDCGRFVDIVRRYVEIRVPMVQVPPLLMRHDGGWVPDLIIGNRIDALAMLPEAGRAAMRGELERAAAEPDRTLHAARKHESPAFATADFETVSLRNHGRTFHAAFIEPLCRKILGVATREVPALYHRAAWLPLYWPETLLAVLQGRPSPLPETHFHYPAAGNAAALVDALRAELLAAGKVRVVTAVPSGVARLDGGFELRFADGTGARSDTLVWAQDASLLARLSEIGNPVPAERRVAVGLCFLVVPRRELQLDFAALFVPGPRHRVYRVTAPDRCSGSDTPEQRLVVEFSAAGGDALPSAASIAAELAELGVLERADSVLHSSCRILDNVLPLPDDASRRAFLEQQQRLRAALPGIRFIGPAAAFLAASINDQIVQGLKTGLELAPS